MLINIVFYLVWNLIRGIQAIKRKSSTFPKPTLENRFPFQSSKMTEGDVLVSPRVFNFVDSNSGSLNSFYFEARKLCTSLQAIVDLQSGVVLTASKEILPDSSSWGINFLLANRLPSKAFPKKLIPTHDNREEVLKLASVGYYHFLIEDLPSLLHLLRLFPDKEVIIAENSPRYLLNVVSELGLSFSEVKPLVKVPKVIYLSHQPCTGWPHPGDLALLREQFAYLAKNDKSAGAKVYISRSRSSRSPKFEPKLESLLSRSNWQIVFAEDLDFREQVALMSSASIVMGAHGAGLANAVWMNPGTTLIEFRPESRPLCYERMAQILNLRYEKLLLKEQRGLQDSKIPIQLLEILEKLSR